MRKSWAIKDANGKEEAVYAIISVGGDYHAPKTPVKNATRLVCMESGDYGSEPVERWVVALDNLNIFLGIVGDKACTLSQPERRTQLQGGPTIYIELDFVPREKKYDDAPDDEDEEADDPGVTLFVYAVEVKFTDEGRKIIVTGRDGQRAFLRKTEPNEKVDTNALLLTEVTVERWQLLADNLS